MAHPSLPKDGLLLHASCVAFEGQSVLITGASGGGKSSLALQLIAYGCVLVSDDQTWIRPSDGGLEAFAPDTIKGRIEARGLGIIPAQTAGPNAIVMVVDLNQTEETRVPPRRSISYVGVELPLYYATSQAAFPAAVLHILKAGGKRYDDI